MTNGWAACPAGASHQRTYKPPYSINNAVIKMSIGTYTIDSALTDIGNYATIEGGFDPANNWQKTSQPGATTIHRTANNVNGTGNTKRISAMVNNSKNRNHVGGFKFSYGIIH